jgi:hypothetical protein
MSTGIVRMNSGTQERIQTELTPQEAEAVLELWARKQAEGELRSRLNVQDLAEATGLDQAEIERLVATVRAGKISPPVHGNVKKPKPVNAFLIACAVVVWFGILFVVGMSAYQEGRHSARSIPIAPPPLALPGLIEIPADSTLAVPSPTGDSIEEVGSRLPKGMRVQAGGSIIEGQNAGTNFSLIKSGLKSFVESMMPSPTGSAIELNRSQVESYLNASQGSNEFVRFVRLTGANVQGKTFEGSLPFPIKRNAMLESSAEAARDKIIDEIAQGTMR